MQDGRKLQPDFLQVHFFPWLFHLQAIDSFHTKVLPELPPTLFFHNNKNEAQEFFPSARPSPGEPQKTPVPPESVPD